MKETDRTDHLFLAGTSSLSFQETFHCRCFSGSSTVFLSCIWFFSFLRTPRFGRSWVLPRLRQWPRLNTLVAVENHFLSKRKSRSET